MKFSKVTSIEKIAVQDSYELSHAQRRLWVLDQFSEANSVYNMPITYNFEDIHIDVFKKAFLELMERHESLRTTIITEQGQPRQKINKLSDFKPAFSVAYIDLRNVADKEKVFNRIRSEESAKPFNLEKGPLVRPILFRMTESQYIFFLNHHHIISDAWSLRVMENDFTAIYTSLLTKGYNDLPSLPIQYKDYAAWQNELVRKDHYKGSRAYWLNEFSGELPVLDMTYDRPRPAVKTYNGGKIGLMTDKRTKDALKQTCMKQDASVFMGLLACINTLLYRYTGQDDIVIGTPFAGRDQGELEDQVGFYVNTLAIRTKFNKQWSFAELLSAVKTKTMEAYEYSNYPFDVLVDQLQLAQDLSRMPLFDVMLSIQHVQAEKKAETTSENAILYSTIGSTSKFDLTFTVDELDKGLLIEVEYNTDLFEKERMERLVLHFSRLLSQACTSPDLPLYKYDLFTQAEKRKLLTQLQGTVVEYPYYKTLFSLFEEQVTRTPDQIAVICGETVLTYSEVNRKANQLAYHLQSTYTTGSGDLVGVMLQRTEWMPIVLLAILKAGGAYVPYDPAYPVERVLFMINDSACRLLITDSELPELRSEQFKDLTVLDLNELRKEIAHHPSDNLPATSAFENLAYIIYTSGSTGLPKGVALTHRNAVALVYWAQTEYESSVFDIVYAVTSYCFDLSVYEIFFSLCSGKKLRILESGLHIPDWVNHDRNILVNTVPSVVQHLLNQEMKWDNVTVLNMAGEPIPLPVKERLSLDKMEVRNLYGPSEYATYSTCYRFGQDHSIIPIGKPLQNTQVYILDDMLNPVPEGTKGEICIAGEQLATGYINRPELTAERFITSIKDPGKKMYKTGDLGRWLPDGNIEFFGRKDYQIKIRGYRIELGEIENTMNRYQGVEESAVIVRKISGESNLYAYYTGKKDTEGLQLHLASKLPAYMMPAQIIFLEAMPLTPNRKIDRKALQLPQYQQGNETSTETVPPSNPVEEKLVEIWKEVLERDSISVRDNFFKIGGHSLKATLVASRLYRELGRQIRIRDVFTYPTIEKLAEMLHAMDAVKPLPAINRKLNVRTGVNIDIHVGITKPASHLTALNRHVDHATTMLLIPSVVGLPDMFTGLAENMEGQFNCYGFRYPGIDGDAMPETISSIAKYLYKEMVSLSLPDQLVITGYSMGGLIAFELTKILEQKGINVKLILLDKDSKTEKSAFSKSLRSEESLETLFGSETARWVRENNSLNVNHLQNAFRHNMAVLDEYVIDGQVEADIIAVEANLSHLRTQMQYWRNYTNGHFEHHLIDCDHFTLLNYENTEIISEILKEAFAIDKISR